MISLFIDTSSFDVSIAIVKDNKILASICDSIPNEHSIYVTSYLDDVIKEAGIDKKDIDKIMVVNGPGSFTGLRIGVTIAKVFAYLLEKKVICVSSLKMRALSVKHDYCLTLINARNDNYYLALYDKDNNEVVDPKFGNKGEVLDIISKYQPICIADDSFEIDDINVCKQELDILSIVDYYKNSDEIESHMVVPEYLKLPQAMEKSNDKRN
ncbi:MAG: tRNA (adenosine(37)-N6)-threonylcarbamoyltransferase complex dimerization subunit type 1 TsaB [Bacilli bacterium]|nr:tRNA (adenosine(37)-N6)-threonylcarbamoyltransferase complex dimerization subunit type 1 TsaB [Bacilli bacterium]